VLDAASVRAKMGELTGLSPVDRGRPGSKIHVLSDRGEIPLAVVVSAANTNDAAALKPLGAGHAGDLVPQGAAIDRLAVRLSSADDPIRTHGPSLLCVP
jgi:hypothetical protein